MPYTVRLTIFIVVFLTGCASVEERVEAMSTTTDPEEIAELVENAIEDFNEDEISKTPNNFSLLMEGTRALSNRVGLSDLNPRLFNRLVESYVKIANNPPGPDDIDDWTELGLVANSTQDFLSAYAIHQLGFLKGPALGEQVLAIVRNASSEGKRITALHAMVQHIDSFTVNNESRAQALAALSIAKLPDNVSSSRFKAIFSHIEELIITQDAINTVLKKQSIYRLDDRAIDYILSANERLWNFYISSGQFPDSQKLQDNVRYMAVQALPRSKQLDGNIPNFSKTQKRAQQMLLAYAPGLYYLSMFENAKISDYSFGQLIATLPFMDKVDLQAQKAAKSLVVTNENGRQFFNHRALLNPRIYTAIKGKAIRYVFKHLDTRVDVSNPRYREFMYSQLHAQFPRRFSDHLAMAMDQPYRNAITDLQQSFYAANLLKSNRTSSKSKPTLLDHLFELPLKRDLNYSAEEYGEIANNIYEYLIDLDAPRFVTVANARSNSIARVSNPSVFADYFITGLNKLEKTTQNKFHRPLGDLLARHSEDVSRKVLGYLKTRDRNEGVPLFSDYVVTKAKKATEVDFILLGNLVENNYGMLSAENIKRVQNMLLEGIKTYSEATALRASQEALAFFQGQSEASSIVTATKNRWPELDAEVI